MRVVTEVELPDAEINDLILRHMYKQARDDFYRYGNAHYSFGSYNSWRRAKYDEAQSHKSELLDIGKWDKD